MNVVDSSAWLAYFAGTANAARFAKSIEETGSLIVPSITIAEVFKRILQQRGEDPALQAVAHMKIGRLVNLDAELAMDAASLGLQLKLPLADSIILATARRYHALVWTQDSDFKNLPEAKYFARAD